MKTYSTYGSSVYLKFNGSLIMITGMIHVPNTGDTILNEDLFDSEADSFEVESVSHSINNSHHSVTLHLTEA